MDYPFESHKDRHRLPSRRQVVVTGLGAVSAVGVGAQTLWEALLEGRSGIRPITRFDASGMDSRIAGEVKDFNPVKLIDARLKPKRMARQAQFAVVAADEAARDAGLDPARIRAMRIGVVIGSSTSSVESIVASTLRMQEKGPAYGDANGVLMCNMQGSALAVAELLNLDQCMAMMISTACASGVDAVRVSCDMIRSGRFDIVICGGTDAPISTTPWAEFTLLGMNSKRNDEPHRALRPFDREGDSGVIGEGCGMLVLESRESALERGAEPYIEILGSHSAVDPEKSCPGSGLKLTMSGAMQNSFCEPEEIDFISAWGCGHPVMDRSETRAIKEVFGAEAYEVAVGSIKGVTGVPLGAAGVLQLVALAMSHRHDLLPPTLNWEHGDLDCDLDYVADRPRRARLRKSLLNAHGMGGNNISMVVAQPT